MMLHRLLICVERRCKLGNLRDYEEVMNRSYHLSCSGTCRIDLAVQEYSAISLKYHGVKVRTVGNMHGPRVETHPKWISLKVAHSFPSHHHHQSQQ